MYETDVAKSNEQYQRAKRSIKDMYQRDFIDAYQGGER